MQDVPPEVEAGSLDEGTLDQEQQRRQSQAATSALTVPPQPAGMAPPPPPPPPQQQQQQQQQEEEEHEQEQEPQPAPIAPPSTTPAIRSTGTTLHSTRQRRSPTQASVAAAAAAGAVESRSPVLPRQQVETDEDHKAGDIESFTAATAAAAAAAPTANDAGAPPTHEYNISGNLVPVSPPAGAARAGVGPRAGVGSGDAEEPRDDDANKKEDETLNFYEWRDVFPELEALASGLPEIMAECLQVASWKAWPEKHYEEGGGQDWKVFPFLHTFPAYDESRRTWVESSCKRCPKTAAILRRLPNIRTALFSRLGGGSRISGHRGWADLANHVLRCHLPIKVPSDGVCGLWVESEVRRHVEGEIIVFDDSKLHKAFNECTEERLVLIVDLLRPPGVPLGTADGDHTPELDAFIDAFR